MNPLELLLTVLHEHMTADSDEIYVETLRLVQYAKNETDQHDYETDSDGEEIVNSLQEAIAEYKSSLREEEEDNEDDSDDDDDIERDAEDLDDDEPVEVKATVFNNLNGNIPPIEEPATST